MRNWGARLSRAQMMVVMCPARPDLIYFAGMLKPKFQHICHNLLVFIVGKRCRTQNCQKLRTALENYVPRYQVCTATNMLEFRDGGCKTSVIGFSQRFGFSGPRRYVSATPLPSCGA